MFELVAIDILKITSLTLILLPLRPYILNDII